MVSRRLAAAVPGLIGVVVVTFFLMRALPGDPAAYFAGKPLTASGKSPGAVPKAATLCTTCHGQDGVAIAPMYPSLAGQHQDYLGRALEEYQKGGRKNPVMKGFAATLSSADIEAISAYFSGLTPSLSTESRPYTRLTAESAE